MLTDYNNRTYRIDDVDFTKNPSHTFELKSKEKISFAQYYKNKYNIILKDMKQPLLVSLSKAKERRGGAPEMIYLIPELCRTTGKISSLLYIIVLIYILFRIVVFLIDSLQLFFCRHNR